MPFGTNRVGLIFPAREGLRDTERAREFEGDKRAALGVFYGPFLLGAHASSRALDESVRKPVQSRVK